MNAGWDRVETLLDALFDLPEDERSDYLDTHTEGEPALRKAVEALLAADSRPVDFLSRGLDDYVQPMLDEGDTARLGLDDSSTMLLGGKPSAHEAPMPETIGQYRPVGKLGEGGMGIVYEAEQTNPRRRVALKVVRGGRFVDEAAVRMFQREVDVLARLRHPNIAGIYESGQTEEGLPYFAMELVAGETLDQHLRLHTENLDAEELDRRLRLFRSIADAVHYAHQRGVIHRDLKPANIIVTEKGLSSRSSEDSGSSSSGGLPETKILDFGLARITEGDSDHGLTVASRTGIIKGTLPYMSPEQTRGSPGDIDLRSDVYSLGVILFEMLTGERPCDTSDKPLAEALRVITEVPAKPLRQAWKGTVRLDPDLSTIVGKALEKQPDDRYASAAAFSEDIERLRSDQPILARAPSAMYQLRKLISRNRVASSFVAAIVALIAFFGVWMGVLWRQSEAARARAEASSLVARGLNQVERSPSAALSYVIAALEQSDSREARELAFEILAAGPTAQVVAPFPSHAPDFSPDGKLFATNYYNLEIKEGLLGAWHESGGSPQWTTEIEGMQLFTAFDPESSRVFVHVQNESAVRSMGLASLRQVPPLEIGLGPQIDMAATEDGSKFVALAPADGQPGATRVRLWDSDSGRLLTDGVVRHRMWANADDWTNRFGVDAEANRIAYVHDSSAVYLQSLANPDSEPILVGQHPGAGMTVFHPNGKTLLTTAPETGEVCFWLLGSLPTQPSRCLASRPISAPPRFDATGRFLATGASDGDVWFWDLDAPPGAAPVILRSNEQAAVWDVVFHPSLPLLAVTSNADIVMWDLRHTAALRLGAHRNPIRGLAFDPAGRWLLSLADEGGRLVLWDLENGRPPVELPARGVEIIAHPNGRQFITADTDGVVIGTIENEDAPVAGQAEIWNLNDIRAAALSPEGKWLAAGGGVFDPATTAIHLRDLEDGTEALLDARDGKEQTALLYLQDGRLAAAGTFGLRVWSPDAGSYETLSGDEAGSLAATSDDRYLFWVAGDGLSAGSGGRLRRTDLQTGDTMELASHGSQVRDIALTADSAFVISGALDGVVRVGPLDGSEPHLLLGHRDAVYAVAADPKGRWIASAGFDTEVRIWPIPTGAPVHTLARDDLLKVLRKRTNYRVVPDEGPTGLRLSTSEFSGWAASSGLDSTGDLVN